MEELTMEDALLFVQVPHRFVHNLMKGLKPPEDIHLNKTQIRTLLSLKDHGPVTMHSLGSHVGMTKGSFTQVIDGLVNSGLAERYRNPEDRRSVLVSITSEGLKVTGKLDTNFRSHIMNLLKELPEKEKKDLINALRTIQKTAENIEEQNHAAAE